MKGCTEPKQCIRFVKARNAPSHVSEAAALTDDASEYTVPNSIVPALSVTEDARDDTRACPLVYIQKGKEKKSQSFHSRCKMLKARRSDEHV